MLVINMSSSLFVFLGTSFAHVENIKQETSPARCWANIDKNIIFTLLGFYVNDLGQYSTLIETVIWVLRTWPF